MAALYSEIPAQLHKNAFLYQVSSAIPGEKAGRASGIVREMNASMTVHAAYDVTDPNIGLPLTKDVQRYKLYANDTGLFITLAFKDKDFTENILYNRLLSGGMRANLGYVYENAVAQMLRASGRELFYHTFLKPDGKNCYEIDFLISEGNKISPIEVKSSGYRSHVSLDKSNDKYSERIRNRYIVYTKDLKQEKIYAIFPFIWCLFYRPKVKYRIA